RIERHEQGVLSVGGLARQQIEHCRLAGVRVADQRNGGQCLLVATLPELRPAAAQLLNRFSNLLDTNADTASIGFELRFTGAARADAAAKARECRASADQARQQV